MIAGWLLALVTSVYGQTLWFGFMDYDDNIYVTASPPVLGGADRQGHRWAFTKGPFGEWYPLAMLSHMLDCQLFGLNAWGHHLTNVLLHAATSIASVSRLWRMTGELWPSAFVATIFAVHPQHVESVAWVAERRDVLSGLFFMLTLGLMLGYVRHGRSLRDICWWRVLFALGLMAKPMLVTLPPLLLLLDFWPLARFGAATDTLAGPLGRAAGRMLAGAGKAATRRTGGGRLPDDAADPRPWRRDVGLAGADGQCGGFLRRLTSCGFSIRSIWLPFIRFRRVVHRRGRWPGRRRFWSRSARPR